MQLCEAPAAVQDARLTAAGPQLHIAALHTQLAKVLTGQLCESIGQVRDLEAGEVLPIVLQPPLEALGSLLVPVLRPPVLKVLRVVRALQVAA